MMKDNDVIIKVCDLQKSFGKLGVLSGITIEFRMER